MKLEYITPTIKVVKLRTEAHIMTLSNGELNNTVGEDEFSNKNTSSMIWGEEE